MECGNFGYLLHHLSSILERQAEEELQKVLGIGFSQFKILMALKWCSGVQQRQIADYLGQTEASISRQIKLLGDQDLLQNSVNPSNRRERITKLTTKGDHTATKAIELLDKFFEPLLANLNPKQQAELTASLEVLHKRVCVSNDNGCGYKK